MNERHEQNRRALEVRQSVQPSPRGNLFNDYPQAFLDHWQGCRHQDCLPQCTSIPEPRHCERLRIAFEAWVAAERKEATS